MDGRRMMVAGGVVTALATIAVGALVVLGSAIALSDSPGTALAVSSIEVPAPPATATPVPTSPAPSVAPTAETVPAPEPEDVAAPKRQGDATTVAAAPAAPPPPAPTVESDAGSEVAAALQRAREWARAQGWDSGRIDAWLAELQARYAAGERPVLPEFGSSSRQYVPETPLGDFGPENLPTSISPERGD